MRHKQLAIIFVCTLVPLFIGNGLFPLLPLYAAQFGATHTMIGLYYAVVYLASVTAVILAGWLAERLPPRGVFVAASALGIPALALLAIATEFWQIVLLTAVIWFCGGVTLTLLNLFTGRMASDGRSGRLFSLMFLAYPLSAVLGGTAVGQLVAWQGYSLMFGVLALVWVIQPLVGFFGLRDQRVTNVAPRSTVARESQPLGGAFALLFVASLLALTAVNIGRLGTSLSMQALAFTPSAIASTAVVSGLLTIPATLLIGVLSDRLGRRRALLLNCLLMAGGAGILIVATQLWHFWLASTLLFAAWCATRSVASALATDILPQAALARGLPRLHAADSIASIVGFAAAGYAFDLLGPAGLYVVAIVLAGAAAQTMLLPQRRLARATRHSAPAAPVAEAARR